MDDRNSQMAKVLIIIGIISGVFTCYTYFLRAELLGSVYMIPVIGSHRNATSKVTLPTVWRPESGVDIWADQGCPTDPEFLYKSASYLLKDLQQTERLQRDPRRQPGQRGLSFHPNFTNPCWYEELPTKPFRYPPTKWHFNLITKDMIDSIHKKMTPIYRRRQKNNSTDYPNGWRLRCLPYIFILGEHKGGTSDFYGSLVRHPLVNRIVRKEPQFWSRLPAKDVGISKYLDFYDAVAHEIERTRDKDGHHPLVTLDGSTHTYSSYLSWQQHPWGKEHGRQCVTLPHHLKYLSPNSKHILLIREPISWLISCYNYFYRDIFKRGTRLSDKLVGNMIKKHIAEFRSCINETQDSLHCVFKLGPLNRCHIVNVIHYVWVKFWNGIMGPEQFLLINSNDYFTKRSDTMSKVFRFLNLPQIDNVTIMDERKAQNSSPHKRFRLDSKTIVAVQNLLEPWNKLLLDETKDQSFNWTRHEYHAKPNQAIPKIIQVKESAKLNRPSKKILSQHYQPVAGPLD